jgi:hypothetical protein
MGYWGGGTVEKEGCEYHPVRVAADKYKITAVCVIRGAPPSTGIADVTLKDGEAFEMEVTVTERKKTYRMIQSGGSYSVRAEPTRNRTFRSTGCCSTGPVDRR